jgi:hypothetical protein
MAQNHRCLLSFSYAARPQIQCGRAILPRRQIYGEVHGGRAPGNWKETRGPAVQVMVSVSV